MDTILSRRARGWQPRLLARITSKVIPPHKLTVICGCCDKLLLEGSLEDKIIFHGICPECRTKVVAR